MECKHEYFILTSNEIRKLARDAVFNQVFQRKNPVIEMVKINNSSYSFQDRKFLIFRSIVHNIRGVHFTWILMLDKFCVKYQLF